MWLLVLMLLFSLLLLVKAIVDVDPATAVLDSFGIDVGLVPLLLLVAVVLHVLELLVLSFLEVLVRFLLFELLQTVLAVVFIVVACCCCCCCCSCYCGWCCCCCCCCRLFLAFWKCSIFLKKPLKSKRPKSNLMVKLFHSQLKPQTKKKFVFQETDMLLLFIFSFLQKQKE